jgi:hypothetical protein
VDFASSVCTGVSSLGLFPPLTHLFPNYMYRVATQSLSMRLCLLVIICFVFVPIYLVYKISEIKVLQTVRTINGFSTKKRFHNNTYIFVQNFSTSPNNSWSGDRN